MTGLRTDSDLPIDRAVNAAGSQSALARAIGISQNAVSRWQRGLSPISPEHVLAIEHHTGVSRHDLRPDIYPRSEVPVGSSTDALEPDMAAAR